MMRRRFVWVGALSLSLALFLAGCANTTTPSTEQTTISNEQESTNETESETEVASSAEVITDGNYPADPAYVSVHGRYLAWNDTIWLSYSASGIEFDYKNCKSCTISLIGDSTASVDTQAKHQARYAVYVNGEEKLVELMDERTKEITLDLSDASESGTIHFAKLSESADSSIGIKGIKVDGTIQPIEEKNLKIEFVGDSITCGYGVDGTLGETYMTANENALKTYAYKTATALDADYHMVSFSGYGIVSGYTGDGQRNSASLMPTFYHKQGNSGSNILTGIKTGNLAWDFSLWQPDIVVINLGTNDMSYAKDDTKKQEYVDAYVAFLKEVREYNPNAKIVCTLGLMGDQLYPQVEETVKRYSEETGDQNISAFHLSVQDAANGYAVDYHPTEKNHQIAAEELTEYLKGLCVY